ncbi:Hypothetical predicted protein, partial [Mytilus galloprovincialis]
MLRDDVRWVLTLPAIWTNSAKQFMRKAANKTKHASDRMNPLTNCNIHLTNLKRIIFSKTEIDIKTRMIPFKVITRNNISIAIIRQDEKKEKLHGTEAGFHMSNLVPDMIVDLGDDLIRHLKKLFKSVTSELNTCKNENDCG